MVVYWSHQAKIDAIFAALVTGLLWWLPAIGIGPFFTVQADAAAATMRGWVGPLLSLLGMMSATTAFLFSVVDRGEFKLLRQSSAEAQLWRVFAENLLWLSVSSVCAATLSFGDIGLAKVLVYGGTYLMTIVSVCLAKFVWVMRQVISVRIAHAEKR